MVRMISIAALLLASAACNEGPVAEEVRPGPINAVYMPDVVDEPDVNEEFKSPVGPSEAAKFVSDNPNDELCGTHDEIEKRIMARGLELTDQYEGGGTGGGVVEVYTSGYDDGAALHVAHGPMEDCLFAEEPTDHSHNPDGTRK